MEKCFAMNQNNGLKHCVLQKKFEKRIDADEARMTEARFINKNVYIEGILTRKRRSERPQSQGKTQKKCRQNKT